MIDYKISPESWINMVHLKFDNNEPYSVLIYELDEEKEKWILIVDQIVDAPIADDVVNSSNKLRDIIFQAPEKILSIPPSFLNIYWTNFTHEQVDKHLHQPLYEEDAESCQTKAKYGTS